MIKEPCEFVGESLTSHHAAKVGSDRHCGSRDIKF